MADASLERKRRVVRFSNAETVAPKLNADVAANFDATMHCQTPDLWQVALEAYNVQNDLAPESERYFLVRWRPPYHFTMMNISDKPFARCDQNDPEADQWR